MTLMKLNNRPATIGIHDLFDSFFNDADRVFGRPSQRWLPAANVVETNDAYHLELSVPGRDKSKFVLKAEKDTLVVSYQNEQTNQSGQENEGVKVLRREFQNNSFQRSFHIGELVDASRIQARYEDGLLKIWLPKRAEANPSVHQISVN
ncbi:MAG: Hsp20/alpha crystallin family protein [Chitinophagaceae bacterium]|nr:Hsp20/alpha crystallin family protein [Chitinophagaceae bacterium]